MDRILTRVRVENFIDSEKAINLTALVDTGASHLTVPAAWREQLGKLNEIREVDCETANQEMLKASVCGPVVIQIEGFKPIYGEIIFLDMNPTDGHYEPLLGYLPLEASQAAVDMLGQRLIDVRKTDMK